ncbi:LysR family transcriptional regulator [Streptomyces sp. WAC05374]|uniref:LysR family substrate-binding domain-containing protein n=1 Tax=Streptomyces sp. WAC05374 TaxID=2487420 RepID=UPI000F85E6C0|nr:LysR family substrate-binding domain-containing protein [Streptomyces sp. WAC05374]RST14797.1 LysR family transcriptional regulator [Streptomyces sp. WAC05374]TDF47835.1 LysR family transcriptional regulator [Streptomyces sp. WAC05374]TDF54014.1 LysR family transcriptional regulator [Streptomyces sp. WAC05374]
MTGSDASPSSFRLAYVPGVTPSKWVRIWNERLPDVPLTLVPATAAEAPGMLRDRTADAGLVRLPMDRTGLSAIPLYTETTVVVVPKDHLVAAADEVSSGDLAEDVVLHPLDDTLDWERPPGLPALERPATTADAVELVAAGIGLLVVPQSLARLHHRKDLTYRPLSDVPQSRVALSWREEETTPDLVEHFIGIVRGRTVNSTRGPQLTPQAKAERPEKSGGDRRKPAAGKQAGQGSRRGSGAPKGGRSGRSGKPRRRS